MVRYHTHYPARQIEDLEWRRSRQDDVEVVDKFEKVFMGDAGRGQDGAVGAREWEAESWSDLGDCNGLC